MPRVSAYCIDVPSAFPHHAPVRVLPPPHKKLHDCFAQFLVRVVCDCGACREIQPQVLARLSLLPHALDALDLPKDVAKQVKSKRLGNESLVLQLLRCDRSTTSMALEPRSITGPDSPSDDRRQLAHVNQLTDARAQRSIP